MVHSRLKGEEKGHPKGGEMLQEMNTEKPRIWLEQPAGISILDCHYLFSRGYWQLHDRSINHCKRKVNRSYNFSRASWRPFYPATQAFLAHRASGDSASICLAILNFYQQSWWSILYFLIRPEIDKLHQDLEAPCLFWDAVRKLPDRIGIRYREVGKYFPPCCASFKSQRDSDEAGSVGNGQATPEREGSCLPSNPLVAEDLSWTAWKHFRSVTKKGGQGSV